MTDLVDGQEDRMPDGVLAFDVNETLLDLRPLDAVFEDVLGDGALRGQWFAMMLQVAFVGAITDRYVDFSTAQRSALRMLADRTGKPLPDGAADRVLAGMRALPPHAEVPDALDRLRDAGRTMAALSNSPLDVSTAQLEHAGIADRFDAILSADEVHALKPRREPYRLVAERFGVPIGAVRLIAAHSWDIAGALAAGCRAAFVARPGMPLDPAGPQPDIVAPDLAALADQLLAG
jgi:2-haloacid dehalogenase